MLIKLSGPLDLHQILILQQQGYIYQMRQKYIVRQTSFLDEVVDGLLRLFVLLEVFRIDSNLGEHFLEDRILA